MEKVMQNSKKLTLTHIFNAPRSLVFKAWTEPEQVSKWWGPNEFTNPVCELDARPGGSILIHMKGPDGMVYPMDGMFKEIIKPEKLVFISAPLDGKGKRLFEVLNTVTFEEEGKKTRLTLIAEVINTTEEARHYLKGMDKGWGQSLARLDTFINKSGSI
jgi:uncharacterized protein YndB with AHSA1/START domain